jgi:hypothetical protein
MGSCALGHHLWEWTYVEVRYPASMYACTGPTTTLAWLLPPVEAGYALSELVMVFKKWDRLLFVHGTMTLVSLSVLWALGVEHFFSHVFMIHLSTAPLNLRGIDFGPALNFAVDAAFATSFVVLRLVVLVGWWVQFLVHGYRLSPENWGSCMSRGVITVVLLVGPLIHGLNLYWASIIVRKVLAKFRGQGVRTGGMSDTGFAFAE